MVLEDAIYHLVDIAIVNAFILYNYLVHQAGLKVISENDFRDTLVLQIIFKYERSQRGSTPVGRPPRSDCRVKHGRILFPPAQKARCSIVKCMALSAGHSGNVQTVHFYQHCARRQNVTVMQIDIPRL